MLTMPSYFATFEEYLPERRRDGSHTTEELTRRPSERHITNELTTKIGEMYLAQDENGEYAHSIIDIGKKYDLSPKFVFRNAQRHCKAQGIECPDREDEMLHIAMVTYLLSDKIGADFVFSDRSFNRFVGIKAENVYKALTEKLREYGIRRRLGYGQVSFHGGDSFAVEQRESIEERFGVFMKPGSRFIFNYPQNWGMGHFGNADGSILVEEGGMMHYRLRNPVMSEYYNSKDDVARYHKVLLEREAEYKAAAENNATSLADECGDAGDASDTDEEDGHDCNTESCHDADLRLGAHKLVPIPEKHLLQLFPSVAGGGVGPLRAKIEEMKANYRERLEFCQPGDEVKTMSVYSDQRGLIPVKVWFDIIDSHA